jgi:hypothetical protein
MPQDAGREHTWAFRTRAIHAGAPPEPTTGARAVPIFQTTSFVFEDTADAADLFALQKYGNVYTRISNPTVAAFEERMASLEGGIGAVATASGMSAEFLVISALCETGDHVVSSAQLYGGTRTLLEGTLARFGVSTTFVAGDQPADFAAALQPNTKLIYTEVVANPAGGVADREGLAAVAHEAGIPLVVDSTVATPYVCRPMEWGADIGRKFSVERTSLGGRHRILCFTGVGTSDVEPAASNASHWWGPGVRGDDATGARTVGTSRVSDPPSAPRHSLSEWMPTSPTLVPSPTRCAATPLCRG